MTNYIHLIMNESLSWTQKYWLDCLNNIIVTRRLNEAIEYLENHEIRDMKVEDNHFTAKIYHNDSKYYNTEIIFKKFSKSEKSILNTLRYDEKYRQSIDENIFTQELNNQLYSYNINLFPSSIIHIDLNCDCRKNKRICQHIIALLCQITNELAINPLLLFELKGYPLSDTSYNDKKDIGVNSHGNDDEIHDKKSQSDDNKEQSAKNMTRKDSIESESLDEQKDTHIKDIEELFHGTNLQEIKMDKHLFLESIPDLHGQTLSIINNKGFVDDDLESFIDNLLDNLVKYIKDNVTNHILFTKHYNDFIYTPHQDKNKKHKHNYFIHKWDKVESWTNFSLNINSNYSISSVDVGVKSNFNRYKSSKLIFGFLVEYSKLIERNLNQGLSFLNEVYLSTIELIRKHAIMPEIFKSNDKYNIRWIPALYNPLIAQLVNQLSQSSPDNLITFNRKRINKNNQIITFISIIIDGIISSYLDSLSRKHQKELLSNPLHALFLGESKKIDVIQNIEGINELLSFKNDKNYYYDFFILIKQEKDYFKLDLRIDIDDEKRSVNEFLNDIDDEQLIKQIEKDLKGIDKIIPSDNIILNKEDNVLLTRNEFMDFFNKSIPLLENMGVRIILPKKLEKLWHPKLVLNITKKTNNTGYLSLDNILDFDWQVAIDDKNISIHEFEKLAKEQSNLINFANEYIIVDYDDVIGILKQINRLPDKLNNYDLIKSMMSGQINDIPVNIDKEFRDKFFHNDIEEDSKLPEDLNAKLRDYQITGYNWLKQNYKLGFGCILADDMGLGKTLQVLTLVEYLKEKNILNEGKVLVVAPTGLLINWQMEISKFTPKLHSHIYHGSDRSLEYRDYDILITSYGMIRQDYEILNDIKWNLIVVDEAQNIKNPSTQQTRAVKSLKSDNKIALTGTPIENNLSEYWSIFDFVNYGYLGSLTDFRKEYLNPIEKEGDVDSLENLKSITQPFVLRRLKTDRNIIKDLPDKITNDLYCNLSLKQAALYEETLNTYMENIKKLESIDRKGKIFELINSLKQICNHPAQFSKSKKVDINDSGKMQLLISTLESILENDEKVLIFTQYVQMGNIIKKVVEEKFDKKVLFLHGSLSRTKRDRLVKKFQSDDDSQIFILSLKAGGTGLNLTAACNVIHYDLWWNPAVENQATDRAYRIGQEENVMVYRFITTGTFEERINDMIEDKKQLADITIASGGKFITEMDDDKLQEILELRSRL